MKCPSCGEFIGKRRACECGWEAVKKATNPGAIYHRPAPKHGGTPFLDPDNAVMAKEVAKALAAGPEAMKKLVESFKK